MTDPNGHGGRPDSVDGASPSPDTEGPGARRGFLKQAAWLAGTAAATAAGAAQAATMAATASRSC